MGVGTLSSPEPVGAEHEVSGFDCGEIELNRWLTERSYRNEVSGASRTFVVCKDKAVDGYYCLSAGAAVRSVAPKSLQRNMPDPLPVLVLGRLAVDLRYAGRGIGSGLLKDAMFRTLNVSQEVGVAALLVHALTPEVMQWYLDRGFLESPLTSMTLFLPIHTIRQALSMISQGQA